MKKPRYMRSLLWSVSTLSLCCVLGSGGAIGAPTDQIGALTDTITRAFTPAQIGTLIAQAGGHAQPGSDDATGFAQLGQTLEVDKDVAIALLRIVDRSGSQPDRQIRTLAQSAVEYQAVNGDLADLKPDDASGQRDVAQAEAAMGAGHFADAEKDIRQLEAREIASSTELRPDERASALIADQHRIRAAQARTLLGKIALMHLKYGEASEDFELARQRISPDPIAPAKPSEDMDAASVVRPSPEVSGQMTPVTQPGSGAAQADAAVPAPAVVRREMVAAPAMPVAVTVPQIAGLIPAKPREVPKAEPEPQVTKTVAKPSAPNPTLPANMVELLLNRGDAMLAIGDVAAARLLYERAAGAGDARGATGAGKTFDPGFLAQIGARGIQPDAAAAAAWYRKAVELGDHNAATRLQQLATNR